MQELGERMSAQEFGDWLVYLEVENIGPGAGAAQWAMMMAAAANGPLTKRDKSLFTTEDFMPARWTPRAPPAATTIDDVRAFLQARKDTR